ncbi:MAG: nodulation protein NfeD [Candidatus Handelsmanbacteria bacterium]|nr:nodulation protein NfeD [Candidatus Handelsmanbacteria bacterium]
MKRWAGLGMLALMLWPLAAQGRTVYHVRLHTGQGMINPGLAAFVMRAIEDAEAAQAAAIVFDIDTFGGRVDAATVIRDAILDAEPLTIAFINKRAISAGALISLACDKIAIAQGGSIGAATAVDAATGEKASDKVISYFRAEMRATAERTGRDPQIAEAMVDEKVEIPELSAETGRPATFTTAQALRYEIADQSAETLLALLQLYDLGDAQVVAVESNWAEDLVGFLTHPVISSLLLAVGIFGLIAEVKAPGWGVGGTIALVCLGVFFGSHYLVHLAEWDEVFLFVAGVGLLTAELFFIPGFGVVGLAGLLCIVGSLLLTQMGSFELWSLEEFAGLVSRLTLSLAAAIGLAALFLRSLPRIGAFNRLVLQGQTSSAEGYVAASTAHDRELVGQEGVTLTYLRPVGVGLFGGKRLDVIAEREFIEPHKPIRIVAAHGNRILVRSA